MDDRDREDLRTIRLYLAFLVWMSVAAVALLACAAFGVLEVHVSVGR